MADFSKARTGQSALTQTSRGGYLRTIIWKEDKEAKFLAFLTPIGDIIKLGVHFLDIADGGKKWRTFVCRKNEIFEDESNGYCPICDDEPWKSINGAKANTKILALAVELEPIYERVDGKKKVTGFEVAIEEFETKDGEKKTAPKIGLVQQALSNFWTPLNVLSDRKGDLTELVVEGVRSGKGKTQKTSYSFLDYDGRATVDELLKEALPDDFNAQEKLYAWIEEHGAASRYEEELSDADIDVTEKEEPVDNTTETEFAKLRAELEARVEEKTDSGETE